MKKIKLFVDTGAFVGLHNKDDHNHERAVEIFKEIARGKTYSKLLTSDYIIDEAITTCRVRTKRHDLSVKLGEAIFNSESVIVLKVDDKIFSAAWKLYKKYDDKDLSFTDCTTILLMRIYDVSAIFSFDRHFDGLAFTRIS